MVQRILYAIKIERKYKHENRSSRNRLCRLINSMPTSTKNEVIALDVVKEKVDMINAGKSPIRDKEIEDFLANKN